jgi:fumarate hydratase class I
MSEAAPSTSSDYRPLFPLGPDETPYRKLEGNGVQVETLGGRRFLTVAPDTLTALATEAFGDVSHLLRPGHLANLRSILDDPEASENDRFVALELLKNAVISASGTLPMCQDTGTAIVVGKKGQHVLTEGDDAAALSAGVAQVYESRNLRYSQLAPLSMFEEKNTRTNLPAQIDISAEPGEKYEFLFIAKGGGSANKSFLFQGTPALLDPDKLLAFVDEKIRTLGTAACPPYHLALVVGGLSAEQTLKTVKLASTRYLDGLPTQGTPHGQAFRDTGLEEQIFGLTRKLGIGAQFGGKYFCHDVRVVRLPRHAASLPIGLGVSCSADRQVKGKITADGVFLEQLETDPARYLPEAEAEAGEPVRVDLGRPMSEIRELLTKFPIKTRVLLSGPMIVARDIAHAKLSQRLRAGEGLPDYFKDNAIYYAGPAKTPEGYASGAFGPTTSARMDPYVGEFQEAGGSFVMLAKGNRSKDVVDACKRYGGFYLGTVGGAAAKLAEDCITKVEVLDYPELGMEAIWRIEVEDVPAFIVIDDKGNDFFANP